jgi:hypothetical protein
MGTPAETSVPNVRVNLASAILRIMLPKIGMRSFAPSQMSLPLTVPFHQRNPKTNATKPTTRKMPPMPATKSETLTSIAS